MVTPWLIVITGLPGTGKTTLAREVARRHRLALVAKDAIKEPLMDVLGSDPSRSRTLSNAAFAVMFAMARDLLTAGVDVLAEGNFRVGEHDASLRSLGPAARFVQLLCTVPESQRAARLLARENDPARHAGHRDAAQVGHAARSDEFLDLPGERLLFPNGTDSASAQQETLAHLASLLAGRQACGAD